MYGSPISRCVPPGSTLAKARSAGIAAVLVFSVIEPAFADLIGLYTFQNGSVANSVSGPAALPDLTVNGVTFGDGSAIFDSRFDYLALPVTLGASPFTIYVDASYDAATTTHFAVSQQSAATNQSTDADFVIRNFPGSSNQVTFYNSEGSGISVNNGIIDGARHRIAITFDGVSVGNFYDGVLSTQNLFGTLPDIDGTEVRFGDRSLADGIGATGLVYEIRIYDHALSEEELRAISPIHVAIDVKPGSFSNPINLRSKGGTPVAILGSEEFDVYDINPASLTLGTAGIKTVGSVRTDSNTNRLPCSFEDVSGDFDTSPVGVWDGYLDLICHFTTMNIVPEAGNTEVILNGELNDGTLIEGSDSVKIVP